MQIEPSEIDILRGLEEALLRPEVRRSADQVISLLAEDFIEIGSSGHVFDKAQVVEALGREAPDPASRIEVTEFSARRLARGVMLVTYRTIRRGTDTPQVCRLRSSIWKLMEGRWQMLFHQGTPAPDLTPAETTDP